MRHWIRNAALALALALVVPACVDMNTVNLNNPDAERALSDPGDVESLLGGTFRTWWLRAYRETPAMTWAVGSETVTSGWGNWTMNGLSRFPRSQWTNNLGTSGVQGTIWSGLYGGLSAVNDALVARKNGLDFGPGGQHNARVEAFGKFMQGMFHAWLALSFDQAYVLDEEIDLESDPIEMVPYTEVFTAAMAQFDEALQIAQSNSFTLPSDWFNGAAVDNQQLIRLIHSFKARYIPQVARTRAERDAVDWAQVLQHANQGVTEQFSPLGDPGTGWYHGALYYSYMQIWARVDYMVIGPADTTGAFEAWYNDGDWTERQEFVLETPDRRIHAPGEPLEPGTDFYHYGASNFHAGAPGYRHSRYLPNRYDHWLTRTGPMPGFTLRELDFIKAEANLRLGQRDIAAELINKTRVGRGGLDPVSGDDPNLMEFLIYEKRLEMYAIDGPGSFFDARGWGFLWEGTPYHFPVPGRDLELLGWDAAYTFGGETGEGSAAPRSIMPRAF
jgi:starch-binding outer membrane protein, SusD/RagB family